MACIQIVIGVDNYSGNVRYVSIIHVASERDFVRSYHSTSIGKLIVEIKQWQT